MIIQNNAVISFTDKCTASCESCCMNCSPQNSQHLDLEVVLRTIDGLNELGIKTLLISGGEPFIYYDELLEIMKHAKKYDMLCSLNTNAFWSVNVKVAEEKLRKLRQNGLTNIITSLDIFHNKYIDPQNVKNLLVAAKNVGVRPFLNLCGGYNEADEGIISLLKELGDSLYYVDIRYFPLSIVGAAKENLNDVQLNYLKKIEDLRCQSYQTLHILSNGSVCACCCEISDKEAFVIGNVKENSITNIVKNAKKCPAYYFVMSKGFQWIKETIKDIMPCINDLRYSEPCEFCDVVFSKNSAEKNIAYLNEKLKKERESK